MIISRLFSGSFTFHSKGLFHTLIGQNALKLAPTSSDFQQIRGRKRNAGRPLTRAQKAEKKARREAREAERKRFTFMERMKMAKMKTVQSPSMLGPGRYNPEDEKDLPERPPCNIFFTDEVRTQFYTISQALEKHRLLQQPSIYGNVDCPLLLRMELNMNTERASKMVSDSTELIRIQHPFKHKEKRTILAFVDGEKLQEEAVAAGADIALGRDMIKKILKGQFMIEDYDFCVAHTNMSMDIPTLRGILRSRFPTVVNGGVGDDLPQIIQHFLSGIKIIIKGDHVFPQWGLSSPVVGRLNMPDEHVKDNIGAVVSAVCRHRNPALGPFINQATLMTIPGQFHYAVDVSEWFPEATENQKMIVDKKRKKKKEKSIDDELESEMADPRIVDPLVNVM